MIFHLDAKGVRMKVKDTFRSLFQRGQFTLLQRIRQVLEEHAEFYGAHSFMGNRIQQLADILAPSGRLDDDEERGLDGEWTLWVCSLLQEHSHQFDHGADAADSEDSSFITVASTGGGYRNEDNDDHSRRSGPRKVRSHENPTDDLIEDDDDIHEAPWRMNKRRHARKQQLKVLCTTLASSSTSTKTLTTKKVQSEPSGRANAKRPPKARYHAPTRQLWIPNLAPMTHAQPFTRSQAYRGARCCGLTPRMKTSSPTRSKCPAE